MLNHSSSSITVTTVRAALAACIVMAGMMTSPLAVRAEDDAARLNRLERDVQTLSRAVYKGETPPPSALSDSSSSGEYQASVETRLSDIESQIRDLTGKVEQQSYETEQLKTRLDRALSDLDLRLNGAGTTPSSQTQATAPVTSNQNQTGTLKAGDMGGPVLSTPDTSSTPPVSASAGTVEMPNYDEPAPADSPTQHQLGTLTETPGGASVPPQAGDDPAGQYEMAFSLMKSGNYASSRNGFETFIKTYPDHPLVGNATYWLGEDYYAEGSYEKAVRVFAESYKKYPKGPKGPDSLLKMGMSLGKLGKTQQACVTFAQIKREYTTGQDAILRRAADEGAKLGCSD